MCLSVCGVVKLIRPKRILHTVGMVFCLEEYESGKLINNYNNKIGDIYTRLNEKEKSVISKLNNQLLKFVISDKN